MTTEVKRLIRVRTLKGARFKRDGYGKKRQLSDSWRKPCGQHSKQREQKKARGALPKPGFGSPVAVRGMHPSGYFEILVTSLKDLEGLDPKTQVVRLGATVGTRKRMIIQDKALTAGLRVLNARVVKTTRAKPAKAKPVKKDEGEEKAEEKTEEKAEKKAPAISKAAVPAKKVVKKAAPKPKAKKTEEKAPAKKAKAKPKPKADKAEETEKAQKPEKKAPAKKAKAKPKAEKMTEAKPKAAAKPKAKTPKSGVKKNE
jgi:large subunit ribosomal protein L32e